MELHSGKALEGTDPFGARAARGLRLRIGLGAGVVLVVAAAGIAVLVSAAAPRAAATTTAAYSSSSSHTASASVDAASGTEPAGTTSGTASGAASSTAFVQVVGQVQKPGLYELPVGDRIVDAVAAAGGFTPNANQASLNLAQVLADGQQIIVQATGVAPAASGVSPGAGGAAAVDINTADATGLETLDGIGPALAQRILAYRTAHGGFRSVNDLQSVTGIGPKKFAEIKGRVSV